MIEASLPAIADQSQRLEALDHLRSFIVQAPAGAGKTELLIQRFLTLLGKVDRPESIVAVTFTRKAAGEMRHRVVDALRRASGPQPDAPHERYTWHLAQGALARDRLMEWHLVDHPSRLRIQTIDALSAGIVQQMPWVSRMGAAPQPDENVLHLYRYAARRLLGVLESDRDSDAGRARALEKLLVHVDNNVGTLEALLVAMLEGRDQWLRHLAGVTDMERFRTVLEKDLEAVIVNELEGMVNACPSHILEAVIPIVEFAARNLVREGMDSPVTVFQDGDPRLGSDVDSLPFWKGLATLLLRKGKPQRRLSWGRRQGLPGTEQGRRAKQRLLEIQLDNELVARFHRTRSLPEPRSEVAEPDVLDALVKLLPIAVAELKVVFAEHGRVDFTEIAHASERALGPSEEPSDLAFGLDCRIQHLLVDEFQDTSQGQFALISRLIEEWRPRDGRTLFLVGDPMQSIYGFRQAEVGLFLHAWENGIGNLPLVGLRLSVNFRSGSGIVRWINQVVGSAFPDTEDAPTGAVTYRPSVGFVPSPRRQVVQLHPFWHNDPEWEAQRVLEIVRKVRSQDPDGTVAILVRARAHLFAIVSALRKAQLRFRAVEIDALGERPVVQDLMALTRALLHPADRIAWLAILRAPWCGLSLGDLEALVPRDPSCTVWERLQAADRILSVSLDGRTRLGRLARGISDAMAERGRIPFRRWVEGVWIELGGPACLESSADLRDADAYLDLLEASVRGWGFKDEEKFMEDVARLFAPPDVEAGDQLQLLTIHKAKGLEFDTVILPGLARHVRTEDRKLMLSQEYLDRAGTSRLLIAPIQETGGTEGPLYGYLRAVETTKRAHESTRLLYVAATRARKQLHLLAHVRPTRDGMSLAAPGARTLLGKIWPGVEREFMGQFERRSALPFPRAPRATVYGVPLRRLAMDWQPPAPLPPILSETTAPLRAPGEDDALLRPAFEWVSELQRRVGVVVHRMLRELEAPDRLDWNEQTIGIALRSEGLHGAKLQEAMSRVASALEGTIQDSRGRWILTKHEDDHKEHAVSAVAAGRTRRFVLDRTFVEGGTRWIIDYKTGRHEGPDPEKFLDNEQERYRGQLEGYARVMRQMDSRPIRMGLYFPLLRSWREWPFPDDAG